MERTPVAISLGWSCESATRGVDIKIRERKENGYLTCPFDECITNYEGVILCLQEDFKHFFDPEYLKVLPALFTFSNIVKGDILIYNTRYNFIFNHESPDHADICTQQGWPGGKYYFTDNGFHRFIERYMRRINNFRHYITGNNKITFIIGKYDLDIAELTETIKTVYPDLCFDFFKYIPQDITPEMFLDYYKLMTRPYDS